MMTIPELKAKIETLDDVAKVISSLADEFGNVFPEGIAEEIERMRGQLIAEKRRLERSPRQLHADAETVVGRS